MAQQNGAKVCQACASTENERQMKGARDGKMSCGRAKTATVKSQRKKKVNLGLCSRNCGRTKFSCQFAFFTESDSASFMHSPELSNAFTTRRPPGFEAALPAPEFLQAYPQPRSNCTGWLLP